ncbi:hypothetical protein QTP88_018114 [Uroleucon formosanum]
MRQEETSAVIVVMKMNVEGKRGRGRPIKRWLENIEKDMRAPTPKNWEEDEAEEEEEEEEEEEDNMFYFIFIFLYLLSPFRTVKMLRFSSTVNLF